MSEETDSQSLSSVFLFFSTKIVDLLQLEKKVVLLRKIFVIVMESIIVGTEVKFAVNIEAQGFSMDDDDFTLYIMRGRNIVKEYSKSDLIVEDDTYLLCVDTEETGVGSFDLAVNAQVPDGHFPDIYRTEIERVPLMTVKKL